MVVLDVSGYVQLQMHGNDAPSSTLDAENIQYVEKIDSRRSEVKFTSITCQRAPPATKEVNGTQTTYYHDPHECKSYFAPNMASE